MFEKLIDASVKHRLLVLIALLAMLIVGGISITRLNLDAFPDVTNIQVSINTEAPGLAAEEVEQLLTFPIESVMYALPDVAEVRSISKTGLSIVTVVFKDNIDIYFARQLVFERLQQAKSMIPDNIGTPAIGPNTSGLGQVYQYLLSTAPGTDIDTIALRSLNDWVVKLLLMPVDGVTDVLAFGGEVRQYQVNVDPSRLLAYDLSLEDVQAAIEANNRNAGGWYMSRGQEQLTIRGVGWVQSDRQGLQDIRQIPLKTIDSTVIRVNNIAEVAYGGEIRQGAVTMTRRDDNGNPVAMGEVVTGVVLKRMGANTKATIDGIKARAELINQAMPEGVTFEPYYDQADLVNKAVTTVTTALVQAFIFIIIVLALFLMNVRATLLVLISIPLSIGLALMIMSYYGISANLMSLGGLAVSIGMLVDGSVVMVENIFNRLGSLALRPDTVRTVARTCPDSARNKDSLALRPDSAGNSAGNKDSLAQFPDTDSTVAQSDVTHAIAQAGREVAKPIFFAAMIILVVFAPLFSLQGVEGKLFQPMAVSIMLAILGAVIVALLVVPALATLMFTKGITPRQSPLLLPLDKLYRRSLSRLLKAPKLVITASVAMFIGALALVPQLGTEFVPELEEGTINIRVTLAPTASLETAVEIAPKLEILLMDFPEVEYALSRIGRAEIGGDPEPVSNIEIYVGLKPVDEWSSATDRFALQRLMEKKLSIHPGLLLTFSQPIATRVDELLSGVKAQLAIKLFGSDLNILAQKGEEITNVVREVAGTTGVALEQVAGEAQLVVRPDRQALSRYGLSVENVMALVERGLGGVSAGQVIKGNERYDIYLRLSKARRDNVEAISNLRLKTDAGVIVRLGDVANIGIEMGPPQIRRDDVQRRVVIQANVKDRDMGSVVADIYQAIDEKVELPTGYSVDIGGQFENQQRAQQRLAIVVPLSIALIALLLYLAFGSIGQAMLILVNVPLALIGGIVSLYLSGQYLSVPSSVGFITLFGVAVLNGVVMVESINQRVADGTLLKEAVFEGALSRLRPVLMTALTSALGLIPMLLSTGVGAEIQKPLASVIVGGLLSATLLTLIVLPVLYPAFSRAKVAELTR